MTLGLCVWLATQVPWPKLWVRVTGIDAGSALAVAFLTFVAIGLCTLRWSQLLALHGARFPLPKLFGWYATGFLFSQFLPSVVGGDGYRIYRTAQGPAGGPPAALAAVVERTLGLVGLLFLGWTAALAVYLKSGDAAAGHIVVMGSVVGPVAFALVVYLARSDHGARVMASPRAPALLRRVVGHVSVHAVAYRREWRRLAVAFVLSMAFHGVRLLSYGILVAALGAVVPAAEVAVTLLGSTVAGMMPVSLGGLGPAEAAFAHGGAHYGVPPEAGVAAVLLSRVLSWPLCAVGALTFLLGGGPAEEPRGKGQGMLVDELKRRIALAMKGGETVKKDILRLALGEIQTAEARANRPLTEDEMVAALRKLLKANEETLTLATEDEKKQTLALEIATLKELLPAGLGVDAIVLALREASEVTSAILAAKSDGQAMGAAMKHLKGVGHRVEGNDVAEAVRRLRTPA